MVFYVEGVIFTDNLPLMMNWAVLKSDMVVERLEDEE